MQLKVLDDHSHGAKNGHIHDATGNLDATNIEKCTSNCCATCMPFINLSIVSNVHVGFLDSNPSGSIDRVIAEVNIDWLTPPPKQFS